MGAGQRQSPRLPSCQADFLYGHHVPRGMPNVSPFGSCFIKVYLLQHFSLYVAKGHLQACHLRFYVSCNSVQRRHISGSNSLGFQLAFSFQSQTQVTAGANLVTKEKMNKTTLFLKSNFFLLPYLPFPPCFAAAGPTEFPTFKAHRIWLDKSELAKGNCLSFALFGFLRGL